MSHDISQAQFGIQLKEENQVAKEEIICISDDDDDDSEEMKNETLGHNQTQADESKKLEEIEFCTTDMGALLAIEARVGELEEHVWYSNKPDAMELVHENTHVTEKEESFKVIDAESVNIVENKKSNAKRPRNDQQFEESLYRDHPVGNDKVIPVGEWEKLMQERETMLASLEMMNNFQQGFVCKLEEHLLKLDMLSNRLSGCGDSLKKLKAKASRF